VSAQPGVALVESVTPETFSPAAAQEGELRVVAEPTAIQIAPQARPKTEIAALLAVAKEWNTTNAFIRTQQRSQAAKKDEGPSWWTSNISKPLAEFLRKHFGPDNKGKSDAAGNVALVQLRLSKPPGKEVVVTPAFKSGDKSVSLAEGARLVFDDSNWNKPALAVIQLDPKLKSATAAKFEIRSGNIPLSWTITFFVLVGLFVLFGLWHKFILPYPAIDQPGDAHNIGAFIKEFFKTFGAFFAKERIGILLLFLLLYRFGEAQLVKMVIPFLVDAREGIKTLKDSGMPGLLRFLPLTIAS